MEDKKKVGLIVTAVTAVLCGCPGLCSVVFGAMTATGSDYVNTYGDYEFLGVGMICLGLIMAVIPIGAGIYTFLQSRKEEVPAEDVGDIPPAI
jgi:hypothetical protein